MQSTQIVLKARPHGEPRASDFETVTVDLPQTQALPTVDLSMIPRIK